MLHVPRNNVSKVMADILPPEPEIEKNDVEENKKTNAPVLRGENVNFSIVFLKRPALIALAAIIIIPTIVYGFKIYDFKNTASHSFKLIYSEALKVKNAALAFNLKNLANPLGFINQELKNLGAQADNSGFLGLSSLLSNIIPSLKQIPQTIADFSALSEKTLAAVQNVEKIKNLGPDMVINQKGEEFINSLKIISQEIGSIKDLSTEIKMRAVKMEGLSAQMSSLSQSFTGDYLKLNNDLFKIKSFTDGLISLLDSPDDQYMLLLLQNPSEIRPAGGFIGSFGYVVLNKGNLKEIKIDDIYNADRQLEEKIAPPKEMRGVTTDWGARDANWFFNFPTSAQKVSSLLEKSKLFSAEDESSSGGQNKNIKFQGVLAINTNVVESIIDIIGSIELSSYNLTLNSQNFLKTIQYEVEAGRDKKPGQNPKKILSALTPILIEKLKTLSDDQKIAFVKIMENHINQKDIMFYFKNENLQNAVADIGVAGEIFSIPEKFNGDYLALVNANIASGKTDIVISQNVKVNAEISGDGKITNKISITKIHEGENEKDWWYTTTNKNYLKVFVPENTQLLKVDGNDRDRSFNRLDYKKNGYIFDENLQNIEKTANFIDQMQVWIGLENSKKTFGLWSVLPAGKTKKISIEYNRENAMEIYEGAKFQFILDKQSGFAGTFEYSITAPLGYAWIENRKSTFEWSSQQLNKREIIELTLTKN